MAVELPSEYRTVAQGLRFPEGPTPLQDGTVLVVEIARGTLSRVGVDGTVEVVADCGGGPNGSAVGPDGKVWITNNGGCFDWIDLGTVLVPGPVPDTWTGGSIQRVDLDTGAVETVYTECDGRPLRAPNDLVFDGHGGFWFTDHGVRLDRSSDLTGVFYAAADGSSIREVLHPLEAPNGVGLSPAGDRLYVAETHTGRVYAWDVPEPGVATGAGLLAPHGELLAGLPGLQLLDSLAVDGEGNVCVGHPQQRRRDRDQPGRRLGAAPRGGRSAGDEHRLRWRRPAHRLRDRLGHRSAVGVRLARRRLGPRASSVTTCPLAAGVRRRAPRLL